MTLLYCKHQTSSTMTFEQFEKASNLVPEMEKKKAQIQKCNHMLQESYLSRDTILQWGSQHIATVPSSLFKGVLRLVLDKEQEDLKRLEEEFQNL
jgi:hypothetical protein